MDPAIHKKLLERINKLRKDAKLTGPDLKPNAQLDKAAQAYADDLAKMDADYAKMKELGHLDSQKNGPPVRAQAAGYTNLVTENALLASNTDPDAAFVAWEKSPGHKANMLLKWIVDSGLGTATSKTGKVYLVNVLGGQMSYEFELGQWVEAQPKGSTTWKKARIHGRGGTGNDIQYKVWFEDEKAHPAEMIQADAQRIRQAPGK